MSLEIKHEILVGHLSKLSVLILPGIAAIGVMPMPVLIYIGYNRADRICIICGSVIAGLAGYLVPRLALPKSAVGRAGAECLGKTG